MHNGLKVIGDFSTEGFRGSYVEEVIWVTAWRKKTMALDFHIIGIGEFDKTVELVPIILAFGRMDKGPLQFILRRETVELLGKDGTKLRVVEIGWIDSPRPQEKVILCRLFSQRGSAGAGNADCSSKGDERCDDGRESHVSFECVEVF
jgi:hypothetical protein